MRGGKLVKAFILSLALVLTVSLGICRAEVGVTDDEIKVGGIMDLSGPIAFLGQGVREGAMLYFKYINDQGGVFGRKINYLTEDDGYQSPRAVQACKKLVERDQVFCLFGVVGSAQVYAMYPFLEARGVPVITPATQNRDMAVPPKKYLFLADTTYTAQGKLAVEWLVEDKGIKAPKIAVLYQDDAPGHDWRRGVQIACKHFNLEPLDLPYKRGAVDFSSQIAKCKDSGITHILMWTLVREPAIVLGEAKRLEYKPTVITANPSISAKVLELAGDAVDYVDGFYATNIMFDPDTEPTPAYEGFKANIAKFNMGNADDYYCVYGYQAASTFVEGLKRAGKDLTREGLIKALETFDNFDNGMLAPITWGPDRRGGGNSVKIFQAQGGKWRTIMKDWRVSKIAEE
ncbi:MAG: ABC transporter substrate-binding protein [Pseudomonadota bacterium]